MFSGWIPTLVWPRDLISFDSNRMTRAVLKKQSFVSALRRTSATSWKMGDRRSVLWSRSYSGVSYDNKIMLLLHFCILSSLTGACSFLRISINTCHIQFSQHWWTDLFLTPFVTLFKQVVHSFLDDPEFGLYYASHHNSGAAGTFSSAFNWLQYILALLKLEMYDVRKYYTKISRTSSADEPFSFICQARPWCAICESTRAPYFSKFRNNGLIRFSRNVAIW